MIGWFLNFIFNFPSHIVGNLSTVLGINFKLIDFLGKESSHKSRESDEGGDVGQKILILVLQKLGELAFFCWMSYWVGQQWTKITILAQESNCSTEYQSFQWSCVQFSSCFLNSLKILRFEYDILLLMFSLLRGLLLRLHL